MPANSEKELERMSRFAKELKLNAVLYGAQEGYRSADLLKVAGFPVLLNVKWPEKPRDADPELEDSYRTLEFRDQAPRSAAALAKAGVKFAFYSGGIERPADIAGAVKKSIDAGLPAADAVRAMTLSVAEIFGVADRLGSIEKGKIANLTVTKGDLFQDRTEIKYVFVDGKKFDPAPAAPAQGQEATR
jgi:imidazolonepropionase-like amidohydrolase